MKKLKISFCFCLLSSIFFTGCTPTNETPEEYLNNTLDPGLLETTTNLE